LRNRLLAAALCLPLTFAACGDRSASTETTRSKDAMSPAEIAQLSKPRVKSPGGSPPEHLQIRDLENGWGAVAAQADEVTIEYVGADYRTGAERWRSRDRLGPFRFQLGGYGVIQGWEQGLRGMRVGGRREMVIPSKLATGEGARIYVVDLLAVHRQTKPPIAVGASDGPRDPGMPRATLPNPPVPQKLVVKELRRGSGKVAEIPGEVTVKYVGIDYKSGYSFFNAWGPNLPSRLSLEDNRSVWARGLAGMRVGGRRELFIPAKLGYGGGSILYAFELTSIN
jgi:FKBP-type peptidyl-prolyl cis-trans isomerase